MATLSDRDDVATREVRRALVGMGAKQVEEWDEQTLHQFVEAAMRSAEPLPDLGSLLQRPAWQPERGLSR